MKERLDNPYSKVKDEASSWVLLEGSRDREQELI
jgi:hypothetical protein